MVFLEFPLSDDYRNTTVKEIDPRKPVRIFQTKYEGASQSRFPVDTFTNKNILRDFLLTKSEEELKRFAPDTNHNNPVDLHFIVDLILANGFYTTTGWAEPPQALYPSEGLRNIEGYGLEHGPVYCEREIACQITEQLIKAVNNDLKKKQLPREEQKFFGLIT